MKNLIECRRLRTLALCLFLASSTLSAAPLVVAKKPLSVLKIQDTAYNFGKDREKLNSTKDPFHLFSNYAEYFYQLIIVNQHQLNLVELVGKVPGWCVGDANAENFSMLLLGDDRPQFTARDLTDSGPCPIILDIFRLMVSAKIYDHGSAKVGASSIDLVQMTKHYLQGLRHEEVKLPPALEQMAELSHDRGTSPNPQEILGIKFIRTLQMNEVANEERIKIRSAISVLVGGVSPRAVILDAVSSRKVPSGGSAATWNYKILLDNSGTLLQLDLMNLPTPAIAALKFQALPPNEIRIANSIKAMQGPAPSPMYKVVLINDVNMLARPGFFGDVNVDLKLMPRKPLDERTLMTNQQLIYFEAYTLGRIHARSVQNPEQWLQLISQMPEAIWQQDVEAMTRHFEEKFLQLKTQLR